MAGDVTVIATMEPKNDAFTDIVKAEHVGWGNLPLKATAVDTDKIMILDSADSDAKKYTTIAGIPGGGGGETGDVTAIAAFQGWIYFFSLIGLGGP